MAFGWMAGVMSGAAPEISASGSPRTVAPICAASARGVGWGVDEASGAGGAGIIFVAIGSCGVAAPALICSSIAEKSAPSPSMPGIAFPAPVGRQAVTSVDRGILAIIKRLPTRRTGYGAAEIAGAIPSAPSARGLPFASAFRRFPARDWQACARLPSAPRVCARHKSHYPGAPRPDRADRQIHDETPALRRT